MDIPTLLKALGGVTHVASTCRLTVQAVGNWNMRNAIPREHHLTIWMLAKSKGVPWTPPDVVGFDLVPLSEGLHAPESAAA